MLAIFAVIALVISVTLHEAMHAFTSNWLGDDTAKREGRITLNPLAHIDPFLTILLPLVLILSGAPAFGAAKPVPFNPYRVKWGEFGAALVGLAGPLTNLVLAVVAALLLRAGVVITMPAEYLGSSNFLVMFTVLNVGLAVFNLIPFPPLDGSRVLYAFAPRPMQKVMEQIEAFGFIGIVVFMFVLFPFISPVTTFIVEKLLGVLLG
jgi:Zn-dependent protease